MPHFPEKYNYTKSFWYTRYWKSWLNDFFEIWAMFKFTSFAYLVRLFFSCHKTKHDQHTTSGWYYFIHLILNTSFKNWNIMYDIKLYKKTKQNKTKKKKKKTQVF